MVQNHLNKYRKITLKCKFDRAFEEYVKNIEKNEYQQKKMEKRRIERKNREAFTNLINQLLTNREITHETKWSEFVKAHLDDPIYLNLVGQLGSTPHEIFEDAISEERDLLNIHKASFKNLVKTNSIKFSSNIPFEQFDAELKKYPEYGELSDKARHLMHEYYLYKIKQK